MQIKLIFLLSLLAANFNLAIASFNPEDNKVISRFDYKGVTLEDSRWKEQYKLVRQEYMNIPVDDLLVGFRKRAGLVADGNELGGWYSSDQFHIFGQVLSGLSRMYAATGDRECKKRVDELIEGWAECIRPDGYFYYSNKPNARHYIYEKMVGGLVDAYTYCGNTTAKEMLSRITDWAIRNLDRQKTYSMSNANLGNAEWYTLSENLYKAYLATGDVKYYDFAQVWEYTEFWNHFAFSKDIFSRHLDYHAYSHVNSLCGAAGAYLVKGDQWYLTALTNAHDYLVNVQCFAAGGYGPHERLKKRSDLVDSLELMDFHFETICGSWAVFKLSKYLLEFTGDAKYGDWIELMMYNGVGASVPLAKDGQVQYTSNYSSLGGEKSRRHAWSCCAGTRPMAVADYHDIIWFKGNSGDIYLNLYTPSTLRTKMGSAGLTLTCKKGKTEFENIITLAADQSAYFALNLRAPNWLASPATVTINNEPVDVKANSKNWLEIKREWADGDKMLVQFPASVRISRIDPDKPMPAALVYGPAVLACEEKGIKAAQKLGADEIAANLNMVDEKQMIFVSSKDDSIRFRPYLGFGYLEPYLMYIDTIDYRVPQFVGSWKQGNGFRFTNAAQAIARCEFEGTGIRWIGKSYDDAGKAEVFIDGESRGVFDQYGPKRDVPFKCEFKNLPDGKHTIEVHVTGQKHPDSKNAFVNVIAFKPVK